MNVKPSQATDDMLAMHFIQVQQEVAKRLAERPEPMGQAIRNAAVNHHLWSRSTGQR